MMAEKEPEKPEKEPKKPYKGLELTCENLQRLIDEADMEQDAEEKEEEEDSWANHKPT